MPSVNYRQITQFSDKCDPLAVLELQLEMLCFWNRQPVGELQLRMATSTSKIANSRCTWPLERLGRSSWH